MLCAPDYRQRPLMFLCSGEWADFRQHLPALREQMRRCQEEVDAKDERGAEMREYALRRKYALDKHADKRVGSMGYGSSFRRSYETGKVPPRTRERRIRRTTTELERSGRQLDSE